MLVNNLQKHREKYSSSRCKSQRTAQSMLMKSSSVEINRRNMEKKDIFGSSKNIIGKAFDDKMRKTQFKSNYYQTTSKLEISKKVESIKKIKYSQIAEFKTKKHFNFFDEEPMKNRKIIQDKFKTMKKIKVDEDLNGKEQNNEELANHEYMVKTQDNNIKCTETCNTLYELEKPESRIKKEKKVKTKMMTTVTKIHLMSDKNNQGNSNLSEEETSQRQKSPNGNKPIPKDNKKIEQILFTSLKFHEVFFCCSCFKYVFAIEKKYHYPNCEKKIDYEELSLAEKESIGKQRLGLIEELSKYTKNKELEVKQIVGRERNANELVESIQKRKYLSLNEIQNAAAFIISKLLPKFSRIKRNGQFFCNNIDKDSIHEI